MGRQLERTGRFLVVAAILSLLPVYLFDHELIFPEGRPFTAPSLGRLLVIAYELLRLGLVRTLALAQVARLEWLRRAFPSSEAGQSPDLVALSQSSKTGRSLFKQGLDWLLGHHRLVASVALSLVALIIILDIRGYSFTARRLAAGGSQTSWPSLWPRPVIAGSPAPSAVTPSTGHSLPIPGRWP